MAEAKWNNPESQRIEAERRAMNDANLRASKISGLNNEIQKLRDELDKDEKVRLTKESKLRALIAALADMLPIEVEPEGAPVIDAPRGRGRPSKAA